MTEYVNLYTYSDGSMYTGYMENGKRIGDDGILIVPNKSVFRGRWSNDKKNGPGFLKFEDGQYFSGTWVDDVMTGFFTCKYGPGHYYQGLMKNGKREGMGEYCNASGTKYSGYWHNNKLHGKATIIYSNGSIVNGLWENGEMTQNFSESNNEYSSPVFRKVLLSIGNCAYKKEAKLKNCTYDAKEISERLSKLGFDSMCLLDGTLQQVEKAIDDFSGKLNNSDVAVIYYSGHGMEYRGDNFLIPIDARIKSPVDIPYQCYSVQHLIEKLSETDCKLKIIILDACRTNPFNFHKSILVRGGLCPIINAPEGTIIVFATSPGSVASDGCGCHSPYATAFLQTLNIKSLGLFDFFNEVANNVTERTGNQFPWLSASPFRGQFFFNE